MTKCRLNCGFTSQLQFRRPDLDSDSRTSRFPSSDDEYSRKDGDEDSTTFSRKSDGQSEFQSVRGSNFSFLFVLENRNLGNDTGFDQLFLLLLELFAQLIFDRIQSSLEN